MKDRITERGTDSVLVSAGPRRAPLDLNITVVLRLAEADLGALSTAKSKEGKKTQPILHGDMWLPTIPIVFAEAIVLRQADEDFGGTLAPGGFGSLQEEVLSDASIGVWSCDNSISSHQSRCCSGPPRKEIPLIHLGRAAYVSRS